MSAENGFMVSVSRTEGEEIALHTLIFGGEWLTERFPDIKTAIVTKKLERFKYRAVLVFVPLIGLGTFIGGVNLLTESTEQSLVKTVLGGGALLYTFGSSWVAGKSYRGGQITGEQISKLELELS